jgi:hypothetical protein
MSSEHTKAFRVKRAAAELLRAEADLMEIPLYTDNKKAFAKEIGVLESDVIDFVHSMLHMLQDTYQGIFSEEPITIPIGKSTYVVMKDGRALRSVKALGAREAHAQLKLKAGEELFIKVGKE